MLSKNDRRRIDQAAQYFMDNRYKFEHFANLLTTCFQDDPKLGKFIHFIKYRIKDEESLRAKLKRNVTTSGNHNLEDSITDFAGLRIIHLHMDQLSCMHPIVLDILKEYRYQLLGSPKAYYWDVEYKGLFDHIDDVEAVQRSSMYMTVHYDIMANQRSRVTCELQVRSLTEELWGEVSHRVNYPEESPSTSCQDQLKVLARLTSGCGRLVDSIFKTPVKPLSSDDCEVAGEPPGLASRSSQASIDGEVGAGDEDRVRRSLGWTDLLWTSAP